MGLTALPSRVKKVTKTFFDDAKRFSLKISRLKALATIVEHSSLSEEHPLKLSAYEKKHNCILNFLYTELRDVVDRYASMTESATPAPNAPIWVCWLQGEDAAPDLVKRCIASLRANAGAHPLNIITEDNYSSYVSLPPHVLEKYQKGILSRTFFSDILRVSLLAEHGGLWIDSTVFCSHDISDSYFTAPVFTGNIGDGTDLAKYVGRGNWTAFLLGGMKNSLLFRYMRDMFFAYIGKFDVLVDFFLIDYVIALGVRKIPSIEATLAAVPLNNTRCHELSQKMDTRYTRDEYKALVSGETIFFKLSYRTNHDRQTADGQPTFFDAFISGNYPFST